MPKRKKKGPGAPVKNPQFTHREEVLVRALYELGRTDAQIAKVLNIPRSTYQVLLKRSGITGTIKNSKDIANSKVEATLYGMATGFEYEEQAIVNKRVVTLRKFKAPELGANLAWLCNRDPEKWKSINRVIYERPPGDIKEEAEAKAQAWADKVLGPFLEHQDAIRRKVSGDKKVGGE